MSESLNCVERVKRRIRHPIFDAIEAGNEEEAMRLATASVLKRSRAEFKQTPLTYAINNRRSKLACFFIEKGGRLPNDGALCSAAMIGDLQVVQALILQKIDVNEPIADKKLGCFGYTPLIWATNLKHFSVMEALLEAGADVNAVSDDGTTAVMFTRDANPKDLEALEILCRWKPDITIKDWRGRNLIREAKDRQRASGKPEMRQILERYFPEVDFDAA